MVLNSLILVNVLHRVPAVAEVVLCVCHRFLSPVSQSTCPHDIHAAENGFLFKLNGQPRGFTRTTESQITHLIKLLTSLDTHIRIKIEYFCFMY